MAAVPTSVLFLIGVIVVDPHSIATVPPEKSNPDELG
jgi:hypothetical protein